MLWSTDSSLPPTWVKTSAVRTPLGWQHAKTGELLVAFGDTSFVENTAAATVTNASLSRNRQYYRPGDFIKLNVQFSQPVIVTGIPQVALTIGANSRTMNYAVRSDNDAANVANLLFEYLVVPGDTATVGNVYLGTAAVAASKTLLATNSGLTYTAATPGVAGNSITVAYVVAGDNTPLTVSVTSNAITVNVATGAGGAATSTAAQVLAAINASGPVAALVTVAEVGNGSGVVSAVTATNLTTGADAAVSISLNGGTITDTAVGNTNVTLTFTSTAPVMTGVAVN